MFTLYPIVKDRDIYARADPGYFYLHKGQNYVFIYTQTYYLMLPYPQSNRRPLIGPVA